MYESSVHIVVQGHCFFLLSIISVNDSMNFLAYFPVRFSCANSALASFEEECKCVHILESGATICGT